MKKAFLTLAIVSVLMDIGWSQNLSTIPTIMSPEVSTLGKYGTYNISYYTGTPNISIPLHQIEENGMSIPINLFYDAGGFIPNKESGQAGLNWSLMSGGAITRIVNWMPDENNDPISTLMHTNKGYIYGQKTGLPTYSSEYIRALQFLNYAVPTNSPPACDSAYEYSMISFPLISWVIPAGSFWAVIMCQG